MDSSCKYRLPYYILGKVQMLIGNQSEAFKRYFYIIYIIYNFFFSFKNCLEIDCRDYYKKDPSDEKV